MVLFNEKTIKTYHCNRLLAVCGGRKSAALTSVRWLALGKLKSTPGAALTVFFAFNHTGIAGQVPVGAETGVIRLIDLTQCAGKPMPTGARLSMSAAPIYIDEDVKFVLAGGYHKGLAHHYGMFPLWKILDKRFAVYRDFTGAIFYVDSRNRSFSSAGSNTKIFHQSTSYNSIFSGF
jgi:hypothetical protein